MCTAFTTVIWDRVPMVTRPFPAGPMAEPCVFTEHPHSAYPSVEPLGPGGPCAPAVTVMFRAGKPPRHQARHGQVDESLARRAQTLVVLSHAPVVGDPGEGALRDPPSRQVLEGRTLGQLLEIYLLALLEPLPGQILKTFSGGGLGELHLDDIPANCRFF